MPMLLGRIVLIGLLLAGAAPAWADEIPPCPEPSGVQVRSFPDQMPGPLMKALTDGYGVFARPGEPFRATDVIIDPSLSNKRIIFVWEQGTRWIVATERGGIGYNDPILVYDLDPQNTEATLVKEQLALPLTVCDTAKKFVVGNP